jgi:hypothetical protein
MCHGPLASHCTKCTGHRHVLGTACVCDLGYFDSPTSGPCSLYSQDCLVGTVVSADNTVQCSECRHGVNGPVNGRCEYKDYMYFETYSMPNPSDDDFNAKYYYVNSHCNSLIFDLMDFTLCGGCPDNTYPYVDHSTYYMRRLYPEWLCFLRLCLLLFLRLRQRSLLLPVHLLLQPLLRRMQAVHWRTLHSVCLVPGWILLATEQLRWSGRVSAVRRELQVVLRPWERTVFGGEGGVLHRCGWSRCGQEFAMRFSLQHLHRTCHKVYFMLEPTKIESFDTFIYHPDTFTCENTDTSALFPMCSEVVPRGDGNYDCRVVPKSCFTLISSLESVQDSTSINFCGYQTSRVRMEGIRMCVIAAYKIQP